MDVNEFGDRYVSEKTEWPSMHQQYLCRECWQPVIYEWHPCCDCWGLSDFCLAWVEFGEVAVGDEKMDS